MQKVLIVTNQNRAAITGIGVYTETLQHGFEQIGYTVDTKDYTEMLDRSNEMYRYAQAGLIHAAHAFKHFTILPYLRERLRDYDLIVVNQPVFLPMEFYTFNHTLNKRMIHVIHDVGFIDMQWGKDRVVGARELLTREDFEGLFQGSRLKERVLDHKNSMMQLAPKQEGIVNNLTDFDVMNWVVTTLSGGIEGNIVCPTNTVRTLLRNLAYRFNMDNTRITKLWNPCPVELPSKITDPDENLVVASLTWAKHDLQQLINWLKEDVHARLHVFADYTNQTMLRVLVDSTPSVKGRVTIETAPAREMYLYQINALRPSLSYHPVAIFETFGYHLLEMAAAGVRTIVPKMEGGLQEIATELGHTIDLDGHVDALKDPREVFRTPKDYASKLLNMVYP